MNWNQETRQNMNKRPLITQTDQNTTHLASPAPKPDPWMTLFKHHNQHSCDIAQTILGYPIKHWDDPEFQPSTQTRATTQVKKLTPNKHPNNPHETLQWLQHQLSILKHIKTYIVHTQYNLTVAIQNYLHRMNQMGAFCHITNPPQRDPPMPEAYSLLPPSGYGRPPQRLQALTIPEQLQATYDVHSKQMSPPRNLALLCRLHV